MSVQIHSNRYDESGQSKLTLEQAVHELQSGNVAEAQRLLRNRLIQDPCDANALQKLAEIAIDQKRVEEATMLFRRAASADPSAQRRLALLHHLRSQVSHAAALAELELFPPALRGSFDVRAIEASALGALGIHGRQIAIYEQLTRVRPANEALWMSLGNALKTVGRTDDAVAALRRAIAVKPTYGEAYWTLSNFKSFRFTREDVAAMRKALKGKLADVDALHFHFALGKALEDRGQYEASFRHYAAGNKMRAKSLSPQQMTVTSYVDNAIAATTKELFDRHAGAGCQARDPIFVLGLQRSGSTLVEQILSSHPLIEGTTELAIIQQQWERLARLARASGRGTFEHLSALDSGALADMGAEFIERARAFRLTDRPFFIDKQPGNWMSLTLIRLTLPNARIIDARRHPMACGFSNFKQNYAAGVFFSYSLESIGRFYRDYWRFMRHFKQVQPGAVHRVVNERLIDDPEGEVRRLLDFIGVPFDPACLEFHRNRRAVRTPSAEQVRRPINADGVHSWRAYEPWLGPLKQALGPALEQWDD